MNEDVRTSRVVYATTNYDSFKVLCGNRGVDLQRVAKIKKSIECAYIPCPIVVNEKMEVIDGQGRLKALGELGLPVYYVVVAGADLNDCIRMNITSTPWETKDYIYSGRDRGNEHYIKLAKLIDRYIVCKKQTGKGSASKTCFSVPMNIMIACAEGSIEAGNAHKHGGCYITAGLFKFKVDYDVAIEHCDYISSLHKIAPNPAIAAKVLLFAKRCPDIDEIRLRNQITKYQKNREVFPAYTTVDECVLSLEALYNYRLSKKIDIRALYNKYREEYGGTAGKAWASRKRSKDDE